MSRRGEKRLMCKFNGCLSQEHSKEGYCAGHARLYRDGKPLTDLVSVRSKLPWVKERVGFGGDECLFWPFASKNKAGYPQLSFRGKTANTHRVMCILAHGEPPFDGAEAAHSCGNGAIGCINPRHLSWKTHVENEADKLIHGTQLRGDQHPNSKLTEAKVRAIKEFARTVKKPRVLAELFNVSVWAIYPILRGEIWKHVT